MNMRTTNSSFSDQDGSLLAYTNGYFIANRINDTMENGDSINPDYSMYQDRLYQGAIFLPQPGNDSIIYLFHEQLSLVPTTVPYAFVYLAQYSSINIFANNGLGRVLKKNIPLVKDTLCYGKLTSTKHGNGRDWWIIVPEYSKPTYFKYLLTPHGIDTYPPQTIGNPFVSDGGQAVFTPDGSKYIKINGLSQESWIDILDFDRCTGTFNNFQGFHKNEGGVTGVSVSLNSRFLYASIGIKIYQYDLWADNIRASETLVGEVDGFVTNVWMSQLAPDGRIYVGSAGSVFHYHLIHNPNEQGTACNFEPFGFTTPTYVSWSIPTFPYYRLGPLDSSPCDTLGIDNEPQAWYRYEQDTLDALAVEFRDLSYYEPATWAWDFGDGTPASNTRHPVHQYAQPGAYSVCLTVTSQYGSDTHCKTLYLGVTAQDNPVLQAQVQVWPNPFRERFAVALSANLRSPALRLYDAAGRLVLEQRLMLGVNEIEAGALPAGLYVWEVVAGGERVKSEKCVKLAE